jgi:hypothetical protein
VALRRKAEGRARDSIVDRLGNQEKWKNIAKRQIHDFVFPAESPDEAHSD